MSESVQRGFFFLFFFFLLLLLKVRGSVYDANGDFFTGTWVLDKSYPLYQPSTCPFIEREFRCEGNGRPDLIYTHYRWQPLASKLLRLVVPSYHYFLFFSLTLLRIITNLIIYLLPLFSFQEFLTQTQTSLFYIYTTILNYF